MPVCRSTRSALSMLLSCAAVRYSVRYFTRTEVKYKASVTLWAVPDLLARLSKPQTCHKYFCKLPVLALCTAASEQACSQGEDPEEFADRLFSSGSCRPQAYSIYG